MTLREIGARASAQLADLLGEAWSRETKQAAARIMAAYCGAVRAHFGISLRPVVRFHDDRFHLEADVEPASDYDALLFDRLVRKEGLLAQP